MQILNLHACNITSAQPPEREVLYYWYEQRRVRVPLGVTGDIPVYRARVS